MNPHVPTTLFQYELMIIFVSSISPTAAELYVRSFRFIYYLESQYDSLKNKGFLKT